MHIYKLVDMSKYTYTYNIHIHTVYIQYAYAYIMHISTNKSDTYIVLSKENF